MAYALAGWSTVATVLVMFGRVRADVAHRSNDLRDHGLHLRAHPDGSGDVARLRVDGKTAGQSRLGLGAVIWNSVLMGFYILRIIFFSVMGGGL
jgi:hypothetical protein